LPDGGAPAERLPAHLEVAGLLRQVQAAGGFAAVLARGERDAGTLLVVVTTAGRSGRVYERMPSPDGTRPWALAMREQPDKPGALENWLERRQLQDPDLWIVELDIPYGERFIGLPHPPV